MTGHMFIPSTVRLNSLLLFFLAVCLGLDTTFIFFFFSRKNFCSVNTYFLPLDWLLEIPSVVQRIMTLDDYRSGVSEFIPGLQTCTTFLLMNSLDSRVSRMHICILYNPQAEWCLAPYFLPEKAAGLPTCRDLSTKSISILAHAVHSRRSVFQR